MNLSVTLLLGMTCLFEVRQGLDSAVGADMLYGIKFNKPLILPLLTPPRPFAPPRKATRNESVVIAPTPMLLKEADSA